MSRGRLLYVSLANQDMCDKLGMGELPRTWDAKYLESLNRAGVRTYAQLAAMPADGMDQQTAKTLRWAIHARGESVSV